MECKIISVITMTLYVQISMKFCLLRWIFLAVTKDFLRIEPRCAFP